MHGLGTSVTQQGQSPPETVLGWVKPSAPQISAESSKYLVFTLGLYVIKSNKTDFWSPPESIWLGRTREKSRNFISSGFPNDSDGPGTLPEDMFHLIS